MENRACLTFYSPKKLGEMPPWFGLRGPLCGGQEAGREWMAIRGAGMGGLENGLVSQKQEEEWVYP